MEKREYAVQYVSQEMGYSTTVENNLWSKQDIELYWDEVVEFWLTGARSGDGLILRDTETLDVVKEYYI